MSACPRCVERGKTWHGDDPTCGFSESEFSTANWNCATVGAIRDLCYEGHELMPSRVDYRYAGDQKYATIFVDDIDEIEGLAVWATWYKNRGRTDSIFVLDSHSEPRPISLAEAEVLIERGWERP